MPFGVQYTVPLEELLFEAAFFFLADTVTLHFARLPDFNTTVIVAVPFFFALIFPFLVTVATFLLLELHFFMESPFA